MNYLLEVEVYPCCQTQMTVDDTGIQAVALNILSTTVHNRWRNTEVITPNNNNDNYCDNTNNHDNCVDVADREIKVNDVNYDTPIDSFISIGKRMIPNGQDLNRQFQRGNFKINSAKQYNDDCRNNLLVFI